MKVKSESEVTQSYPTLSDPMDCSLPGSSVQGIFQARVLEWGAIAFSCPPPLSIPKYIYLPLYMSRVFCIFKLSAFLLDLYLPTYLIYILMSFKMCILHVQHISVQTSHISNAQKSHVTSGYCGGRHRFGVLEGQRSVSNLTLEADCVQVCTETVQQVTLKGM